MFRLHIPSRVFAVIALGSLAAGCSGGGGSSPAPSPTQAPVTESAYTCPSSDAAASVASGLREGSARRGIRRAGIEASSTGLLAVTYGSTLGVSAKSLAVSRESLAGATLQREFTFSHIGRYIRVVRVAAGSERAVAAKLRAQPGVLDVAMTGLRRSQQTVATNYFSNDPYYTGFTAAQLALAGSTATPTFEVGPYEETASLPGQWGMHAMRLDYAQAYSQPGNGSGIVNAGALGSSAVKIAILDSGVDTNHPELNGKVVYQKCFVTDPAGNQSTSSFTMDPDGHGTDVAGLAAEASNNGIGFAGTGGNTLIYAYRIFPEPDDSCTPGTTKMDAQCDAASGDIAAAIDDAVTQRVNVISMSFGAGTCSPAGVDPDSLEGAAIANAIAANVVVVAASGNDAADATPVVGVSAPGCDNGVIAAGASALSDGVATGTATAPVGTSSAPIEYVASYSQYGAPAAAANNSNAWGIVAPGGDPSDADASLTGGSTDYLHWIENVWTTTPFDSKQAGTCTPDLGSTSATVDCRILIAGTSMSTPEIAGAAALIIAANPAYQSPAKMKQLLCSTAHDIGDAHEGCGRLDIYRAMATAVGDPTLPTSQ